MSMKMTSTTMNTFENFLSTTSSNLRQISRITKPIRKNKKKISMNEKAKNHLDLIVKSMNGKLIICNESIVLIEVSNVDGTVQQHLYKYINLGK